MIPTTLRIVLPGEPFAQMRPRARVISPKGGGRPFSSFYDPAENRSFKATAQIHMQGALEDFRAAGGTLFPATEAPLLVEILAVFPCPKSDHRKTTPRPRRFHTGNKDWDNIGKAVCDAGTGILWRDDHTVSVGSVTKLVGAQIELPRTIILVRELEPSDLAAISLKFANQEESLTFQVARSAINAALESIERNPAHPINYAEAGAELDERDGFEPAPHDEKAEG